MTLEYPWANFLPAEYRLNFFCASILSYVYFSDKKSLYPQGLQIKQSDHLKKIYYDMWVNV